MDTTYDSLRWGVVFRCAKGGGHTILPPSHYRKGCLGMRKAVLALAAILATIVLIGVGQVPAHADVTGVKGSA
jgi:hypothetical protein